MRRHRRRSYPAHCLRDLLAGYFSVRVTGAGLLQIPGRSEQQRRAIPARRLTRTPGIRGKETKVNIDKLKELAPLVREFEVTERQLAMLREYKGEFLVIATQWQPPPPPHGGPERNHVRFENAELIDTVIDLLERRLARLRTELRAAGIE
jgi:hypothetical protein